jgi:hypothetical protein
MPKRLIRVPGEAALLDLVSYARPGPASNAPLAPTEIARIARTVARAPEVVVKVSGGAKSLRGALAHVRYIDRHGQLEIETDEGEHLRGEDAEHQLLADWDLGVADAEARSPYRGSPGRKPSKIVHNVVLSMPAGTSPQKLLAASRDFAREEFASKHRYAMVLHTDQDHPHVHLVLKAMGEEGRRLNIRKATLRQWRQEFARHLRAHGVAANATERAVRGQTRKSLRDGIYRAAQRRESTHLQQRLQRVVTQLRRGGLEPEQGKVKLLETRKQVMRAWHAIAEKLLMNGEGRLAEQVWKFIGGMPPVATDIERFARGLQRGATREEQRTRELSR